MKLFPLFVLTFFLFGTAAEAREQIRIVGSSTVYPFATTVAEQFGRSSNFKTPVVESTGSGGGLKLFCAGLGKQHPDITNTSRAIKKSEIKRCRDNGVNGILQVKVGYDGIVLANKKGGNHYNLSLKEIFLALAKVIPNGNGGLIPNPNKKWSDIRSDLPNVKIEVLGPPPTSGTRDAFVELAMEGGAKKFPSLKALRKKDKKKFKAIAHGIREDGHFVEAGENDNLIVQKLNANPNALGIFGFSFLDNNMDMVQGSLIGGKDPSFENISSGDYPVSRSLYFYVKEEHLKTIPGLKEYLEAFTAEKATGEEGYLIDKGLIPLPAEEHKNMIIKLP